MRNKFGILLLAFLASGTSGAQVHPDFYSRYDFLMSSPGVFQEGLVGFANPANLALLKSSEQCFYWSSDGVDAGSFRNWGYFLGTPHLGFGLQHQKSGDFRVYDFRLSLAFGHDDHLLGLSYGWSKGDREQMGREKIFSLGAISRPVKYVSVGFVGNLSLESNWNEGMLEIGLRPLGTPTLALFADGAIQKGTDLKDAPWSAGAVVEVAKGINLTGRYFDGGAFTVGLSFNLGLVGIAGQSHYNSDQDLSYYTYHVRAGGMRPSFIPRIIDRNKRVMALDLNGRVDYLKYVLGDKKTLRLMRILEDIRAAAADPRIGVIALNLSSMRVLPEHAWEIREELKKARAEGKKIIVFFDNADLTIYHLASVADKIVIDPEGLIMMTGYCADKTYFKGTLDKLGLGFDEWRFFKYKSALEVLSREGMSDADREQYQDYIDDMYELVRADISESRPFSPSEFDAMLDNVALLLPQEALRKDLVDTLGRWSDLDNIIENLTGSEMRPLAAGNLLANALPSEQWGEKPKIAVVYGVGDCAMETGIKARWLERVILRLSRDNSIKAVVFRVDSPGGEGTASDFVAEAIRKCAEEKPVVVSQGQLAGSGGYWISMYGDSIIAGPNTITGSIGVIGGWLYDNGFGRKIGMTSDMVKRGKHADIESGITLPFLNLTVPARNLHPDERKIVEELIKKYYDIFVKKVADGRNLSVERVREIGEGHFYSGQNGKEIGLVDKIGGLMMAIEMARTMAGLKTGQEYDLVEIPHSKGLFDLGRKTSPLGAEIKNNAVYRYIKMLSENPGKPLPMLIPGTYPSID
jgi:protease-4